MDGSWVDVCKKPTLNENMVRIGSFTLTDSFRFQTPMVTLYDAEHVRIAQSYTRILLPISVKDRNPSSSPYPNPSPAM